MNNGSQGQPTDIPPAPKAGGTSPELTGGQGFTFEDAVSAVYAAALLCESTAPGLPGRIVTHVSVQQGSFGQPLDDLIVRGRGADQISITFSAQVKRKLTISAAQTNDDFRETIERAHITIIGDGFKVGLDRVGAIVGEVSDASKRTFEAVCEWARAESSSENFATKLRTDGAAGDKLVHFQFVRTILSAQVPPEDLDAAAHQLLAHFILIRLELLTEGSPTESHTVSLLANVLAPTDRPRADDLWRRLLALVRASQGRAAAFDRKTLVAALHGAFRLSGGPSLKTALAVITQESRLAATEIGNSISGLSVPREGLVDAVIDTAKNPGFVQIAGLPGTGKSAVLRSAIERLVESGPVLFLKSDRLQGSTWAQYAAASGIAHAGLEELLVEIGAAGASVLFIDGIDRIEVPHRGVIIDLLNTIHSSTHLSGWSVVASVRDTGMEPLRTWLPSKLFAGGIRTLVVDSFDDEEAEALAQAKPALQRLLFGPPAVQSVVRRPFFAAVLAKESDTGSATATSEVDLASLWWQRGGYAADPRRVGYRRNALVELARAGANQLGRRIPVAGIDAAVLVELEADGIIRSVRLGHSVQFVHDIFFEWAFLQYLVSEGEDWVGAIQRIGEPPALGRVVELHSQTELVHRENWAHYLATLEADNTLRSQWLRAWMAGPFSLETFEQHASTFDRAMFDTAHARVGKLIVWYQAEKTQPNTKVLERSDLPDLDIADRMLYADMLGYPSDIAAWARFCTWLLEHAADLPVDAIPDVVAAFGVWQNQFAHYRNLVSERVVQTCLAWLYHIEHQRHRKEFSTDQGTWAPLNHDRLAQDELEQLERSLRTLVLNASLSQRMLVAQYVRDLQNLERLPREAVGAVFLHAPFLARVCPTDLVDFTLAAVRRGLPVDLKKHIRGRESASFHSFSEWDWERLSIDDKGVFFPSAPTREPFHSLLAQSPDEGRRLIRELANHAIRAWRQLHRLSYRRAGTPIPIVMRFPWGTQVFWGGFHQYMAARGNWGPAAVNSGLMALEAWAFQQIDNGVPVDDVLQKVLEGQTSLGALAVAVAISLRAQQCSAVSLPIATNQRIWHFDIHRQVQDFGQTANLIGFKPHERDHAKAVQDGNALPVRRADIRSLATLMLLKGGELSERTSSSIQRFPDDLPYGYAHERTDEAITADLLGTAQIWAELGKLENYRANLSEDESKVLISVENPKASGPNFEAIQARHVEMSRHLRLLNWAHSYFENGKLKDTLTIEDAVAAASELDNKELFETGYPSLDPSHERQTAVAAVGAVVAAEGATEHLEWAIEVCVRACRCPEVFDELYIRKAKLVHHPVLFAARGLGAFFRVAEDEDVGPLQSLLTELVCHPYEEIAVAALQGLLSAWEHYPNVAWAGLRLATELASVEVRYDLTREEAEAKRQAYIRRAVASALERLDSGNPVEKVLPGLPSPWVQVSDSEQGAAVRGPGRRRQSGWELNPMRVDVAFLQKVFEVIPVDAAVADELHASHFLAWCEGLVGWTIERIAPSWASNRYEIEESAADYYQWKRYLYRFLAKISLRLPATEGIRRFLAPAIAADDETFGDLCESFTSHLTVAIADSPEIPPVALELLKTIVDRVLEYRDWRYAGDGGGRAERELVEIVGDLFFSNMQYAGLAVRFANRQWAEVGAIIPSFDPILKAHGSVAFVARAWMNVCEISFDHYPLEHFVSSLEYLFGPDGRPSGWRDTQLPARLSGLIQRFSERAQPMSTAMSQKLLRALDRLVDMGDRRAAAVQLSEVFRSVRVGAA